MRRNPFRQADLALRLFCRRLGRKQRKIVLGILFVPFALSCICTAVAPLTDGRNRDMEYLWMRQDTLRKHFIQTITEDAERRNQETAGTAAQAVRDSVPQGRGAAD